MVVALITPFITIGILFTAYLALIALRNNLQRDLLSIVVAILSFSLVYVAADTSIMIIAVRRGDPALAVQFNRVLELAVTGFMPLIPYFVKTALPLRKRWKRLMQGVSVFCLIAASLFAVIAMSAPDYFLSLDSFRPESSLYTYGRGIKGPVLFIRDLLFLGVLILSFTILLSQRPWRFPRNPRTGLLLGFAISLFFGLNALILNLFNGVDLFHPLRFSRVGMAIVFFSLSAVLYYVRQFSLQAAELNEANRELDMRRARLGFLAYHDELSQLPNRSAFLRDLSTLIESLRYSPPRSFPFGHILAFDLNGFSAVMNSYGPRISDMTLIAVSKRLQGIILRSHLIDAGAYHFGGDNFALLVPRLKEPMRREDPLELMDSLRRAMSKPFSVEGIKIYLSASVAHVALNELEPHAEEYSRRLARTLGEAKARRNFAMSYTREMEDQVRYRIELIQRMREALSRDEFTLYYQPIIESHGECREAEALIRWRSEDPQFRPPGPGEFIPAAEESGLIVPLTERVVERACGDLVGIRRDHPEFRFYINISPRHLESTALDQFILKKLAQYGLPSSALGVEITETAIMSREEEVRRVLDSLKSAGLKVAIDDFGTGYSSLSYLKEIPADRIKVDRSFIAGIPEKREDTALVESIAALGLKLGKEVVAEGVETEAQHRFAVDNGIPYLQGYLFAKPAGVEELSKYLKG